MLRYRMTKTRLKRLLDQAYQHNGGRDHQPAFRVIDTPSKGTAVRVNNPFGGASLQLLSKLEYTWAALLIYVCDAEALANCVMLPLELTQRLAHRMKFPHPTDPDTGLPWPVTTDLVARFNDGGHRIIVPFHVKYEKDGISHRSLQKYELEHLGWQTFDRHLERASEANITRALFRNLRYIWAPPVAKRHVAHSMARQLWIQSELIARMTRSGRGEQVTTVCGGNDRALGIELGTSIRLFRELLRTRYVKAEAFGTFIPNAQLRTLDFSACTKQGLITALNGKLMHREVSVRPYAWSNE